jgi:hypothetical protein
LDNQGNDNSKGGVIIMSYEGKDDMMGMMSKMMQGGKPEMMMEMMPKCLGMMLQNMQKDDVEESFSQAP